MPFRPHYGKMENMPRKRTKQDEAFGARLKDARKALSELKPGPYAVSIGLHPGTYRNYERGDRRPSQKALEIFVDEGMSLNWLYIARRPILDLSFQKKTG